MNFLKKKKLRVNKKKKNVLNSNNILSKNKANDRTTSSTTRLRKNLRLGKFTKKEHRSDVDYIARNAVRDIKDSYHKNIQFEIESWSSFISTFHPKNILIDSKVSGQVSKWSVDFKSQNEFLYLKLEKTTIVYMITFGKFKDPTNLKEFKIFAGLDKSNMTEILHSGLSMEEGYEPFIVRYKWDETLIPCNYLKIVPLRPWDDSYNISVWFLNVKGVDDEDIVEASVKAFNQSKEIESMKNWISLSRKNFKYECLNLFKAQGFEEIIKKVENPKISNLYDYIMNGNFECCIEIIDYFCLNNYFDEYIKDCNYRIKWKKMDYLENEIDNLLRVFNHNVKLQETIKEKSSQRRRDSEGINGLRSSTMINIEEGGEHDIGILEIDSDFSEYCLDSEGINGLKSPGSQLMFSSDEEDAAAGTIHPLGRGGHSMVLDDERLRIYLFGGWDGSKELNDFWYFDLIKQTWHLIPSGSLSPSLRSCHKMVFDSKHSRILLYGKYNNPNELPYDNILYEFDTKSSSWRRMHINKEMKDGRLMNSPGPGQVFDHSLLLDAEEEVLYLFGGSRIPEVEDSVNGKYLGLWKLDLKKLYWENLLNEQAADPYNIKLKTRCGHSMVMNTQKELIIYGGNKGPRKINYCNYLFDMVIYNTKNKTIREHFHDYSKQNGPFVNFSFCSFYNLNSNELYFFGGGLINEKNDILTNNFWVYNFYNEKWTMSEYDNNGLNYDEMNLCNNFYDEFINITGNIKLNSNSYSNDKCNMNVSNICNTLNEPLPRYAHCMVFSHKLNRGYIFGGNPNIKNFSKKTERLDDFWEFELNKMSTVDITSKLKLKIYKLLYKEQCGEDEIDKACNTLRNDIVPLLTDENKSEKIQKLTCLLIQSNKIEKEVLFTKRFELFEKILKYTTTSPLHNQLLNR